MKNLLQQYFTCNFILLSKIKQNHKQLMLHISNECIQAITLHTHKIKKIMHF